MEGLRTRERGYGDSGEDWQGCQESEATGTGTGGAARSSTPEDRLQRVGNAGGRAPFQASGCGPGCVGQRPSSGGDGDRAGTGRGSWRRLHWELSQAEA